MCTGDGGVAAIDVVDGSGRSTKIACDALAVSGGWNPAVHLTCHLNGKPVWNEALAAFVPGAVPEGMHVAGAANGTMKLADCLSERRRGGRDGGGAVRFSGRLDARAERRGRARRDHAALARESRAAQRRSWISRTTSRRPTSRSPIRRASPRSSTSSATRRWAWRPIRARSRTSPALRSLPKHPAARSRKSAPRPIARLTCR